MFTRTQHQSLSLATWIQSTLSNPISLTSILILYCRLCLDLQGGFFTSDFLTKILNTFLISPMHATCPAHLIILVSAPHYATFFSLLSLHPSLVKIFSSAPCYQNVNLRSSLKVRDQTSFVKIKSKAVCNIL
jgi:hypothetical protein